MCALFTLYPRCKFSVKGASVQGLDLPLPSWVTWGNLPNLSFPACRMGLMIAPVSEPVSVKAWPSVISAYGMQYVHGKC